MQTFKYEIKDDIGIHARPAGLLVKEAKQFQSRIMIESNGKSADATKLMAIMSLGVKKGTEIVVRIEGDDEDIAAVRMEAFMKSNL